MSFGLQRTGEWTELSLNYLKKTMDLEDIFSFGDIKPRTSLFKTISIQKAFRENSVNYNKGNNLSKLINETILK